MQKGTSEQLLPKKASDLSYESLRPMDSGEQKVVLVHVAELGANESGVQKESLGKPSSRSRLVGGTF